VSNLVGNALEHGGRDVRVTVGLDGSAGSIEVTDRGQGIPPEHLGHLFERFYKADPSRTAPGSGLGLAITLENVRLLGGDIDVWSEVGTGTRFTVRLPVTQPVTQRLLEGETAVTPSPDARASG
jgi:signal transduction histidine kinase